MPRSGLSRLQLQTCWPHIRSGQQPSRGESSPASLRLFRFLTSSPEEQLPTRGEPSWGSSSHQLLRVRDSKCCVQLTVSVLKQP